MAYGSARTTSFAGPLIIFFSRWAAMTSASGTSLPGQPCAAEPPPRLAKFLGATVSAKDFAKNMKDTLPGAYARLAKAIERAVPLYSGEEVFDASRVILTAYPDMLVDETGEVCPAGGKEEDEEDRYPANQSLDAFSSWLATTSGRLNAVHEQLAELDRRMKDLSGDHGWTYAGRVYNDRVFQGPWLLRPAHQIRQ